LKELYTVAAESILTSTIYRK